MLIDSCITQLKAQGPSRTCNESNEEEEKKTQVISQKLHYLFLQPSSRRLLRHPPHRRPRVPRRHLRVRFDVAWFKVQGSGCRVQGSGFRVQGSGFRV